MFDHVLFPLLTARRRILWPNRRAFSNIVILAMLQTFLQYLFFYIGLSHTTASKASVLNSLHVFVAVLAACLLFHQEQLGRNKIVACVLGFASVVLVNISGGAGMQISLLGEGFMLFAAVSYAFSSVVLKRFAQTQDPVMLSGWQFLLGGVLLCLVGVCAGGRIDFCFRCRCVKRARFAFGGICFCLGAVARRMDAVVFGAGERCGICRVGHLAPRKSGIAHHRVRLSQPDLRRGAFCVVARGGGHVALAQFDCTLFGMCRHCFGKYKYGQNNKEKTHPL